MRDFLLKMYRELLDALLLKSFFFIPFENYKRNENGKCVILRHDVDEIPKNALLLAQLERDIGIKATYYFRIVPQSFDEKIIRHIVDLGHEVGYHYENLSFASQRMKNEKLKIKNEKEFQEMLYNIAIDDFKMNLEKFRKIYPVKTICMHGNPLSKYDNRKLWEKYDYRDYGIIGEPYFDIDFNEVFYLTDTGRRWDGDDVNVRDKVKSKLKIKNAMPDGRQEKLKIKSTDDIIKAAKEGLLPDKIMLTIHPQRWTDNPIMWMKELVWQNFKNVVKRIVVKRR